MIAELLWFIATLLLCYLDVGLCYAAFFLVMTILGEIRPSEGVRYAIYAPVAYPMLATTLCNIRL